MEGSRQHVLGYPCCRAHAHQIQPSLRIMHLSQDTRVKNLLRLLTQSYSLIDIGSWKVFRGPSAWERHF